MWVCTREGRFRGIPESIGWFVAREERGREGAERGVSPFPFYAVVWRRGEVVKRTLSPLRDLDIRRIPVQTGMLASSRECAGLLRARCSAKD